MGKLFKIGGFLPYLLVIFLNAFVDLGHKITIQNTVFKTYDGQQQVVLTAIVNALILLPFILLFTPSGFIADKYPKNRVIKISAAAAVVLACLITLFYYLGLFWMAFAMTFLLAVQSAIYSPAKFGYIREIVGNEKLSSANGLVQAVTMVAILTGTFVFSFLFEGYLADVEYADKSELIKIIAPLGWFLILASLIEFFLTFCLPQKSPLDQSKVFDFARYRSGDYLKSNLSIVYNNSVIWLSIIGLSVFWAISQVLLASFPAFAKESLAMNDTVIIQGMMAFAGIGVMLGSITSGKLSSHHIETGFLPLGAIGIAFCLMIIPTLHSVIGHSINFMALGFFGGLFVVPLNALIQFHAKEHELGLVLAANNLIQTSVMLFFLILTVLFSVYGFSPTDLIHLLMVVAFVGTAYTLYHLPQSFLRLIVDRLISSKYRLHVQGFKNIPETGGVLMLGNHVSFIDWAILQMACPRTLHFVMDKSYYERWYLKWLMNLFGTIPIAKGSSKVALESISELLNKGQVVCLFPEGVISRTGQLNEFKHGYEKAAANADGQILPFYLHGLWGSRFSRSSSKLKRLQRSKNRRDLIVAFGKPLPMTTLTEELKQQITELSIESWQCYSYNLPSLASAWLRRAKSSSNKVAIIDSSANNKNNEEVLKYRDLISRSFSIARLIKQQSHEQNIGLLLPTSALGLSANLAVLLNGKTIVNLNYLAETNIIQSALEKSKIETLYTSKEFLEHVTKDRTDLMELLSSLKIVFLCEQNQANNSLNRLINNCIVRLLPVSLLELIYIKKTTAEDVATIVFSNHKSADGVMLSQRNLLINIKQSAHVLNTEESDTLISSIPLFNSYGLTVNSLMPLIEGIPIVCHPDPQDCINISRLIIKHHATILCSTAEYLALFEQEQKIDVLMLETLRHVVADSEVISTDLIKRFKIKFNKQIYSGYGSTETSPVASVNVPNKLDQYGWQIQTGNKEGTVGLPLPGTSFRIVNTNEDNTLFETLDFGEQGQILIGGPQVMLGYLNDTQKTEDRIIEMDDIRWFKTADQGWLDKDGFLTIVEFNAAK